ncbi:hypothetical protein EMIT0P258_190014 [Pseudomonas sp. IT-P258]
MFWILVSSGLPWVLVFDSPGQVNSTLLAARVRTCACIEWDNATGFVGEGGFQPVGSLELMKRQCFCLSPVTFLRGSGSQSVIS